MHSDLIILLAGAGLVAGLWLFIWLLARIIDAFAKRQAKHDYENGRVRVESSGGKNPSITITPAKEGNLTINLKIRQEVHHD